jgi:hypothetical protein
MGDYVISGQWVVGAVFAGILKRMLKRILRRHVSVESTRFKRYTRHAAYVGLTDSAELRIRMHLPKWLNSLGQVRFLKKVTERKCCRKF